MLALASTTDTRDQSTDHVLLAGRSLQSPPTACKSQDGGQKHVEALVIVVHSS